MLVQRMRLTSATEIILKNLMQWDPYVREKQMGDSMKNLWFHKGAFLTSLILPSVD